MGASGVVEKGGGRSSETARGGETSAREAQVAAEGAHGHAGAAAADADLLLAGIELGGPVTAEDLLAALYDGLRLAVLLCCVGAANTLANPKRALRSLPAALYELGVAVVGGPPSAEAEIHTIGVDPGHQGRGIGRALLRGLLAAADAVHATVYLEVRTDNDPARALYESEGFTVVGLRRRYYRPSGADAHTMRRERR